MAVWDHGYTNHSVLCDLLKVQCIPCYGSVLGIDSMLQGSRLDQGVGTGDSSDTLLIFNQLLQVAYIFIIATLNGIFNIGFVWRYTITLFGEHCTGVDIFQLEFDHVLKAIFNGLGVFIGVRAA